jgi:hypothetical protein
LGGSNPNLLIIALSVRVRQDVVVDGAAPG